MIPSQAETDDAWHMPLAALGSLREGESMARHTTLGVGGPARWFFRPANRAALVRAMQLCPAEIGILPLGRGSNMLVPDIGIYALVVDLSELNELYLEGCMVRAEAGVRMSRFARQCAEHGLSGCEFMATVPGDIGGGVVMNAGCFSQQVSDTLKSVDVMLRSGEMVEFDADELEMSYRHVELPNQSIVVSASFELRPDSPDQIRERMRTMRSRRSSTQPLAQPNCGSVFKNPEGDHAARLIEAAGLKGFSIGGARISSQHANFIVNEGEASSADIVELIRRAQRVVKEKFEIELEPEVRMVGEWM
ncbi:UDP-N-acetylmuramate dehydrogenase [Mariprofundus ferrinatatus]|uniref:UDP-N-acetylenolpyruvoylglucosamine reductase n=1 Tax=Mariprofundus ferrinatatus TaxID=1921087 RepID=A0A2K8LEI0_9PROT|nr:UDP-N-acetylmuramate dehydrogenase [Mariprofundus ferrinatatus]ATX82686.1 UDP-N-acetylmuramate dehydrogenase [Mariprofundus ferrinatatus]